MLPPRRPSPRPKPAPPAASPAKNPPPLPSYLTTAEPFATPTEAEVRAAWEMWNDHAPGVVGMVCRAVECGGKPFPCPPRTEAGGVLRAAGLISPIDL